ncbi:trans-aconitate 2-methyltransferase [Rhodoblastus acidophilus]|uniref:Trans-aconitate 2-methyltransferase n=1 Tax=Rhodoblastus acidophilus TaxID=1074 RepID=A0A212RZD4_RHOAC|nr:trans-aconitate 2-methyltransferase [Rhodoblastus acidophilus]MCW2314949.1 trans-aconitate 2-methyltransferase [Rhodoblastus acidophilus]PPQ36916.1 trans-aconitate 2-methyltransferase [Rhodoblastus acidophilus]RAI22454.1 trans-aconitate 2-methyltransferase [Rhodoblastus acidophilus]SNB78125.1 trans-aconitate 2-methyltransferase [Rhodoblastus acidophilus]
MRDWNCDLYLKFERERAQAARDLLSRVPPLAPRKIVDLGCGPGNSSAILSLYYRCDEILGIDRSPSMIKAARARLPAANFVEADLAQWTPEAKVDLIFANSAIHFAPSHEKLLPKLLSFLKPGGVLAVQMPNVLQDPAHALMRMVAVDGPWMEKLAPVAKSRAAIGSIDDYYAWLSPHVQHVDLWQTVYVHPLNGHDEVIDWFAGSALLPFLDRLGDDESAAFLAHYRRELEMAYLAQDDGKVLLHYPRLFFVAQV